MKAGGLRIDGSNAILQAPRLCAPDQFTAPRRLDSRDYCLTASDQGSNPSCTGYAVAGYLEVQNWLTTHLPLQIDGQAIYDKIKSAGLDSWPDGDGSTLEAAFEAAAQMGMYSRALRLRRVDAADIRFAIHTHRVVVCAFHITEGWSDCNKITGRISRTGKGIGGHAVLGCWYDDLARDSGFGFQNQWAGTDWGYKGFGRMTWDQFDDQFLYGAVLEHDDM